MPPVKQKKDVRPWPFSLRRRRPKFKIRAWNPSQYVTSCQPSKAESPLPKWSPVPVMISPLPPTPGQTEEKNLSPGTRLIIRFEKLFGKSPVTPTTKPEPMEDSLYFSPGPLTPKDGELPLTPGTPTPEKYRHPEGQKKVSVPVCNMPAELLADSSASANTSSDLGIKAINNIPDAGIVIENPPVLPVPLKISVYQDFRGFGAVW